MRTALVGTAVASALISLACYASYRSDQARLREIALRETRGISSPAGRAIRLTYWVYHNRGFSKNHGYFLIRRLGPTPVQVLDFGGDCADKSRLLASMLREIGIPTTVAMCFDRPGNPTHTVVDARLPDGTSMVLDPIWDLYFPREAGGGYYGLLDLRRDPSVLWRRLEVVTAAAPPGSKILRYNVKADIYDYASTINWDKNRLTRSVRTVVAWWLGDRVFVLPRPTILEEPKLLVAASSLLPAAVALGAWGVLRLRHRVLQALGRPVPGGSPGPQGKRI
jgi:hypothetical protein